MEQLVARWKQTTSSTNASRYSDKKMLSSKKSQNHSQSPSSSSSESLDPKTVSAKKSTPQKLKQSVITVQPTSASKSNRENESKRLPKSLDDRQAIDSAVHLILKLFKGSTTNVHITDDLRNILEDFASQYQTNSIRELEGKIKSQDKQLHILRMSQSSARDDLSRKMIMELENKLADSEHQKNVLSSQKETIGRKLNELLQDVDRLTQRQEIHERTQRENDVLQKNNVMLLQQIKILQEKDANQQIIWNQQVEDLLRMMDILKTQLQKQ